MESVLSMIDVPIVLVFIAVFLLCYMYLSSGSDLPPGPRGWPLIGNMLFYKRLRRERKKLHLALVKETEKYGNIIHMKVGGQHMVYLHGYEAIQEAFVKHADVTSDRPSWLKSLKEATKEGKGVIWQSGQEWKTIRKFVLQTFRDFGVGKTSLEEKIFQEIDAATEYLHNTGGKPTDIRHLTSMMITNVIYGIVFDKRFEYKDKELSEILEKLDTLFRLGGGPSSGDWGPRWFMWIINKHALEIIDTKRRCSQWIKSHVYRHIEEHEDTFDSHNIRDFVDLYIQAKNEESDKSIYNAGNMFRVIMDIFIAGSETTSNTINWCILYMQEYPDIQKHCRHVIQEVCGGRRVTWSDRGALPYVEAVLLEIQRMANIAPFSVAHTNEEDTTLLGYKIPRHTLIVGNLYSSNIDPKHWHEPHEFNPERFLENGKLKKNPAFMPFSIGPRICLGESLAKMEMFLIFTNLLQRFTFQPEDPNIKHSFQPIFDQFTSAPLPYKTRATPC